MARCYGFPWVTQLFLKRQGHRELSFSGRQQTNTLAHAHLHVQTHFQFLLGSASLTHRHQAWKTQSGSAYLCPCTATSPPPRHWLKWKGLIEMIDWNGKALSGPAATATIQRWRVQCCWQQPQSLVCRGERLFKRKVLFCVKAQRCSNDAVMICASVIGRRNEKVKSFPLFCTTLEYIHDLRWHLKLLHNTYVQYSTLVGKVGIEGDPQFYEDRTLIGYYCWCMIGTINLKTWCACNTVYTIRITYYTLLWMHL